MDYTTDRQSLTDNHTMNRISLYNSRAYASGPAELPWVFNEGFRVGRVSVCPMVFYDVVRQWRI